MNSIYLEDKDSDRFKAMKKAYQKELAEKLLIAMTSNSEFNFDHNFGYYIAKADDLSFKFLEKIL